MMPIGNTQFYQLLLGMNINMNIYFEFFIECWKIDF